jgi:hypothetical protein
LPIRWRLTLLNALIIGVILLTLAGTFAYLWYGLRVNRVENTTERQAEEAAKALADGEDLLGRDRDELEQATAGGSVVILIRNAQGKLLGQMPKKPDFSMEGTHDPVWKRCYLLVSPSTTEWNSLPKTRTTSSTPGGSSPLLEPVAMRYALMP